MTFEKSLEIVKEMQAINTKQIANRKRSIELSKKIEKGLDDREFRDMLNQLEIENDELNDRTIELSKKLKEYG